MSKESSLARVLLLLAALWGGSCVSLEKAAPPVAMLTTSVASKNTAQLSWGRDIYVTRCVKCHSVEPVAKYSRVRWEQDILPEMSEETNLTTDESEAVKAYVLAVLASTNVTVR